MAEQFQAVLNVALPLLGVLASSAICIVLWRLPRRAILRLPHRVWLVAWGVMLAHFSFQALYFAGVMPTFSGYAQGALLVVGFWMFSDWAVAIVWPRARWGLRGLCAAVLVATLAPSSWPAYLSWPDNVWSAAISLILVAGGVAAIWLPFRTALSRGVLAVGMLGWAFGMGGLQYLLAFLRIKDALLTGAIIDMQTLICKILCGFAMVLVVLDEQRDFLDDLFEHSPVWLHLFDQQGRIQEINQTGLRTLGLEKAAVLGRPLCDFCGAEKKNDGEVEAHMAALREGRAAAPVELEIVTAHGVRRTMLLQARAMLDAGGRFAGGSAVIADLSRERGLQQQLLQGERMQAVGTLAAGIAHDFNNLLTIILGQLEQLRLRNGASLNADVRDRVEKAESAAKRGAQTIERLLQYARPMRRQETLELADLVRQMAGELEGMLPEGVEIHCRCAGDVPPVRANAGQVRMVLQQLVRNAEEAMPGGGRIEIDLGREMVPHPQAVLRVRDTGCGIAPEVLPHIFDPFFTTHFPGGGTGLGLAMVQSILKAHGGQIEIKSQLDRGSEVTLRLPAAPEGKRAQAAGQ